MVKFENIRKHWIWAMVAFLVTTIIAVITLYFQYKVTKHELGGFLNATFHSRLLNNRDARTIVICLEDTTLEIKDLYITPTFDNPSDYSLKDFYLSFDAECSEIRLIPTSFVEMHEYGNNEWIYSYKENVLAAHEDTRKPFSHFELFGNQGRCYIRTKASYNGALSAFTFDTDVWFFIVPNPNNLSFDNWKINCKKRIFEKITDQYYDVYYVAKNRQIEYQFDVDLTSISNNQQKNANILNPASENISRSNEIKKHREESQIGNKKKELLPVTIKDVTIKESGDARYPYIADFIFDSPISNSGEYLVVFDQNGNQESQENGQFYFVDSLQSGDPGYKRFLKYDRVLSSGKVYPRVDSVSYVSTSWYDGKFFIKNSSDYNIYVMIIYSPQSTFLKELTKGDVLAVSSEGPVNYAVFKTNDKPFFNGESRLWICLICMVLTCFTFCFIGDYFEEKRKYYNRKDSWKLSVSRFSIKALKYNHKNRSGKKRLKFDLQWIFFHLSIFINLILTIYFIYNVGLIGIGMVVLLFPILIFTLLII